MRCAENPVHIFDHLECVSFQIICCVRHISDMYLIIRNFGKQKSSREGKFVGGAGRDLSLCGREGRQDCVADSVVAQAASTMSAIAEQQ